MKKVFYGIIIFVFSCSIGIYYSAKWKKNNIGNNEIKIENIIEETNFEEEKVDYDCKLILKTKYNTCGHYDVSTNKVPIELVNLTREELEKMYPDYELKQFSNKEIILSREVTGICKEHYVIKLEDGIVEIYYKDENEYLKFYRSTDICKEYLADEDIEKLEQGIPVYGKEALRLALEDYE